MVKAGTVLFADLSGAVSSGQDTWPAACFLGGETGEVLCMCLSHCAGTASRPPPASSGRALGPSGWTRSAALDGRPAFCNAPGHRGGTMTAATMRTWVWPVHRVARDIGHLWVRTQPLHHCQSRCRGASVLDLPLCPLYVLMVSHFH